MQSIRLAPLALILLLQASSPYYRGMELWRSGDVTRALRQLMTAMRDPEFSFYASRQVAGMGAFALPALHQGLWDEDPAVRRQSAIVLGWIGAKESAAPLLSRMKAPDAPLEVEYALRKIGSVSGDELFAVLFPEDLSNPPLLDHKVAGVVRLARSLRAPIQPLPLLELVRRIEAERSAELDREPFGYLANARLNLLRFLAERKVSGAAEPLVRTFRPGVEELNRDVAQSLIELGPASLPALETAFRSGAPAPLRPLLAVTHYLAAGEGEIGSSRPAARILNEAHGDPDIARETAGLAASLSAGANPLLSWFSNYPEAGVRMALAVVLAPEAASSQPDRKAFFMEKSRDPNPEVAAAHLRAAASYLPDPEVEQRCAALLASLGEPPLLRAAALEAAAAHGLVPLLEAVIRRSGDPLQARAVELSASRAEPRIVSSVLDLLVREGASLEVRKAAISVAAERWKRPEARDPLWRMLRSGDASWIEAARGLAALGASEAFEPFTALIDAGRTIDPDEAAALYFALTGIPARLVGSGPGSFRFEPLRLSVEPPEGHALVLLRERSDYRGWVKVEERWKGERRFRLDEARQLLVLYDREAYDRIASGERVIWLEETVRQEILNPLELAETREQRIATSRFLPRFPVAGLEGQSLRLVHEGRWAELPLGSDLRFETDEEHWGRSALVALRFFDLRGVRYSPEPPPSGWERDAPQPVS